jgi:dolichol-phosphate mannosyltransferase
MLSIVLPVYKSRAFIAKIYERILSISDLGNNFEIIYVNDGCPEGSWDVIRELAEKDRRVIGVNLSRNFGQHFAITAGLEVSQGDIVIVMDCDLQEDPKEIPLLLNKLQEDQSDMVLTLRKIRAHGVIKKYQARVFYALMKVLGAENEFGERVGTFSCLSRKAVIAFLKYDDVHRHYLMIVRTLGFKKSYVEISHSERMEGHSSYSFLKLLNHSLDGLVFQSNRLLKLAVFVGVLFILASAVLSLKLIWGYVSHGSVPGYTSLMLSIFICSGVILFILGIQGVYIGKIFDQTRNRPLFIIDKILNR